MGLGQNNDECDNMASDGAPRSQSHLTQIHRQNGQQQRGAVLLNFRWTTVRGEEAPLRSELPSDNASAWRSAAGGGRRNTNLQRITAAFHFGTFDALQKVSPGWLAARRSAPRALVDLTVGGSKKGKHRQEPISLALQKDDATVP